MTALGCDVPAVRTDPVLDALDQLVGALREDQERLDASLARAVEMRAWRQLGRSYREIECGRSRSLVLQLTQHTMALVEAGSRLRRAEAAALHAEGMTMDQIAELFGVTRQRVSALLKPQG